MDIMLLKTTSIGPYCFQIRSGNSCMENIPIRPISEANVNAIGPKSYLCHFYDRFQIQVLP